MKTKEVNEEDVIRLVNEGIPVLAVIDAYKSFQEYKDVRGNRSHIINLLSKIKMILIVLL